MARPAAKTDDLTAIEARREQLKQELAELNERSKAAALAAKDAGREIFLTALGRVKIPAMDRSQAKVIAKARS
ncbi:hypothetical protein, partial [Novosphingobium sp. MBES04]|uniref:hypothetical protein n=2 Tax=Novosphingobium TaxID=165696 RepID=UPI0009FBB330